LRRRWNQTWMNQDSGELDGTDFKRDILPALRRARYVR